MIFLACLLTVLLEGALFAVFGYRDRFSLTVVVCANVITNLTLNIAILLAFGGDAGAWIWCMEAAVVAAEYAVYARAFGPGGKLFLLTLAANCLSYCAGLLIF